MTTAAATIASRLEQALGSDCVSSLPADCAAAAVDGVAPAVVVNPASDEQAAEVVRLAAAEKLAVIPMGARTKLGIGAPPARFDIALCTKRLNQIAHYDPGDLTLSVGAGMTLLALDETLKAQNQFLPLAVPFFDSSTVGGAIASGVDAPLRQFYGTARDFVIGAEFVTGEGALAKSGGRVVKNVTGYDLHKLLIGSLGTLAVITRVNFRTFPIPPHRRGFLAAFPAAEGAIALRNRISSSPLTPSSVEILSPECVRILFGEKLSSFSPELWVLCVSYEGAEPVVNRYSRELAGLAGAAGAAATLDLDDAAHGPVWQQLCDAITAFLAASASAVIFRISVLPGRFAELFAAFQSAARQHSVPHALLGRGSGTIYLALSPPESGSLDALAKIGEHVFQMVAAAGGHAMLPWCPAALKRSLSVWGPARPDAHLMRRVKNVFDPAGILAPGRYAGGI